MVMIVTWRLVRFFFVRRKPASVFPGWAGVPTVAFSDLFAARRLKSAPLDMKNVELWRSGLPSHHGLKTIPSETLGSDYPERLSRLRADLKDT